MLSQLVLLVSLAVERSSGWQHLNSQPMRSSPSLKTISSLRWACAGAADLSTPHAKQQTVIAAEQPEVCDANSMFIAVLL